MGSYKEIPLVERITEDYFKEEIYPKRKPVVIRGMNIGPCTERWTAEYLMENCSNVNVKVHVCSSCRMDFVNKNFSYGTLTFDTLVHKTSAKDFSSEQEVYYYLRSLGDDPRKEVADIGRQFPLLAQDITVPQLFPNSKFFSSVFRLASPGVSLWTHYDVMDNILIQIKGKKRAVMFPPEDILYLYMKGDKSQVLDIDEPDLKLFPEFSKVTRYERILEPGDIIFIPALWFHNMKYIDFGIAVNVFWKHLDEELYDRKDPYGNKDLVPAGHALTLMDKALKSLNQLPEEYKKFYVRRMLAQLQQHV